MSTGCLDSKTLTTLSSGQRRLSLRQPEISACSQRWQAGWGDHEDRPSGESARGRDHVHARKAGIPRNLSEEKKCGKLMEERLEKNTLKRLTEIGKSQTLATMLSWLAVS